MSDFCHGKQAGICQYEHEMKLFRLPGQPSGLAGLPPYEQALSGSRRANNSGRRHHRKNRQLDINLVKHISSSSDSCLYAGTAQWERALTANQ